MALELNTRDITVTIEMGDEEIECYCVKPTASEVVAYRRELIGGGRKITPARIFKTQVKYGLSALKGIRKGDVLMNGKPVDESPDWKKIIEEKAPQIPEAIARLLYEPSDATASDREDKEDDGPFQS